MPLAHWFRPPLRTLTLFLGLVIVLGGALGWLGWQVIESDRRLERSGAQERLATATDRISAALRQHVSDLERLAAAPGLMPTAVPAGVVVLHATPRSFEALPEGLLVFQPVVPNVEEPAAVTFDAAEALENQRGDLTGAIAAYQALARSPKPEVRAGALARLARTLRKAGRQEAALAAYDQLSRLDQTPAFGLPAALQASEGRCSVLEATGRTNDLRQEATRMAGALLDGRSVLVRPAWEFKMEEARRWGAGDSLTPRDRQAIALSNASDWVYSQWSASPASSGRRASKFSDEPTFASWVATADRLDAVVAGLDAIRTIWSQAIADLRVEGGLLDENRQLAAGAIDKDNLAGVRTTAVPGLPWTFYVASADGTADAALLAGRRLLLFAGFAVLAVVLVAGSFFITRSIARERAVARLQSEFVSAVSHEFRTPLTALRQLSEMLAKGRVPTEPQRQQSYEILSRESERLQRLVESLLDFGRVQAGAFKYQFEPLDGEALVRQVVAAFGDAAAAQGLQVELQVASAPAPIRADRDAVSLALRNLLENAVKYSPDCRTIWVDTSVADGQLDIRVRDRGIGIPVDEQRTIFNEFVRGAGNREAGIKGTGIGLTLASHIVSAHHGEIRVESAPGQGSTFTIRLPLENAKPATVRSEAERASGGGAPRAGIGGPREESESASAAARATLRRGSGST